MQASHWTKDNRFVADFTKVNLLFWGLIAAINYFQDVVLLSTEGNEQAWSYSAVFSSDWLLWAILTPFIYKTSTRFPFSWKRPYTTFLRQFGFATTFVIIHTALEFVVIEFLIHAIFTQHAPKVSLPGYFIFSIHSRYIVYFLLAGGIQRYSLYIKYKQSEVQSAHLKEQLVSAQLESLRMRLQPHFLFNTHNTINSLLLKKENEKAGRMLMRLSDLLRKTLEESNTEFITVRRELEMIKLYTEIHRIRFSDRLTFVVQAGHGIQDTLIPSFLLQPLIESLIAQCIEPTDKPGTIRMVISRTTQGELHIQIDDHATGWSTGKMEGEIMSVIHTRLNRVYGTESHAWISCDHSGTRIEIRIPEMKEVVD